MDPEIPGVAEGAQAVTWTPEQKREWAEDGLPQEVWDDVLAERAAWAVAAIDQLLGEEAP